MPLLLFVFLLAACAGGPAVVPRPLPVAPVAPGSTETMRFEDFGMGSMRRGQEIGRYVWDIDCGPPYSAAYWTTGRNLRQGATWAERFYDVMADAGFTVAGGEDHFFDKRAAGARARFAVHAELRDVRLRLCNWTDWLFGWDKGIRGDGTVRVDWAVTVPEEERLVYRVTTVGSATLNHAVPQGDLLLIEEAYTNAAVALAADAGFRAALTRDGPVVPPVLSPFQGGASPIATAPTAPMPDASVPDASVPLATPVALRGVLEDNAARIAAASARVGRGRGVVVGEAGGRSYLLVPNAALGEDVEVSVRPAGGPALRGTVERRDARSGLSLVRVPDRLPALPVRLEEPEVSEPVYALADGGTSFAGGILAGRGEGVLHADLTGGEVAPGDPLLDEAGNLLGIAVPASPHGGPAAAGLGVFLPAAVAFDTLGIAAPGIGQPAGHKPNLDGRGMPPT
ncbi:MAG TPA: serine protease [Azospirillum sp.]|nr:serine protease [Azospirillum sp.]